MVCFTQHQLSFAFAEKDKWFNLIEKFFSGCKIGVKFQNSEGESKITFGSIDATVSNLSYALSLVSDHSSLSTVIVQTARIWDGTSFVRTIPYFSDTELEEIYKNVELDEKIADAIVGMFKERIGFNGDMLLYKSIDIPEDKLKMYAAYALRKIGRNNMYYCPSFNRVYVLIDDVNISVVEPSGARDMPSSITFDLDDGFLAGTFGGSIPEEFNLNFQSWVDGGRNPEEEVLKRY